MEAWKKCWCSIILDCFILLTGCHVPFPCLLQTQLHHWCFVSPCLISANTGVLLVGVCVCALGFLPSSSLWVRTLGEILSIVIVALCHLQENLLFYCLASWSSWAPAVQAGGKIHRYASILACHPIAGSFLRQHCYYHTAKWIMGKKIFMKRGEVGLREVELWGERYGDHIRHKKVYYE